MNKKNLSVVMAGAMLATSVAPVLAAESTVTLPESISASNATLLADAIYKLMDSEKVSDDTRLVSEFNIEDDSTNPINHGESIYGIQILDKDGKVKSLANADDKGIVYTANDAKTAISNIKEGETVKVFERAHNEFLGLNITTELPKLESVGSYNDVDIENIAKIIKAGNLTTVSGSGVNDTTYPGLYSTSESKFNDYIINGSEDSAKVTTNSSGKKEVTFKLRAQSDISDTSSNKTVTITEGQDKLNFTLPIGKDDAGNDVLLSAPTFKADLSTDIQKAVGFYKDGTYKKVNELTAEATEKNSIKITAATDSEKNTYLVSELYDGFAFTAAGTELSTMVDNKDRYDTVVESITTNSPSTAVEIDGSSNKKISDIIADKTTGIASAKITVKNKNTAANIVREITVFSTDVDELKAFLELLVNDSYSVGVIGGANRYETAVNVAKAQVAEGKMFETKVGAYNNGKMNITTSNTENNIVLVNGTSLVDGLAAAPYAAKANAINKVSGGTESSNAAPVLLTDTDKLPKATKDYINDITSELSTTQKKDVTVTLVGGKSVLSDSLKEELEGMGFTVKRLGGENREETSLKVAEAMGTVTDAFVVGANGEADAMSIGAVAAKTDNEAPIIVSSVHGLTEDALEYMDARKTVNYTVVGGESVISKSELDSMSDTVGYDVARIAGETRFETNAKIIEKYYNGKNVEKVVAVKDGQSSKSELVDALSSANYAAGIGAPIVLASKDVKSVQSNAILKVKKADASTGKVVQVGEGSSRTVLETIAKLLDVSNVK